MDVFLFLSFLVSIIMIFAILVLLGISFRLDHRASDMQLAHTQLQEVIDKVDNARQAMDRLESRTQSMHERQLAILESIRYSLTEEKERLRDIESSLDESTSAHNRQEGMS